MTNEASKPTKRTRVASKPEAKDVEKEAAQTVASAKKESPGGQPSPAAEPASTSSRPFGDQIDMLAGVAGKTAQIVYKAASVLEEELNTGIGGAQKLEEKFVDVEKLRSANPQEVMQRFRRDAHDVVDILIDLVNVATNAAGNLTQRMIKIQMEQTETPVKGRMAPPASAGIPALTVPTPVKAGGEVQIPMTLENESSQETEAFNLLSSDLVNSDGERISAGQIRFTPERMVLEPHKSATVTVMVQVPANTRPGLYSGLLQASKLEQLRAVLTLQIE